MKKVHSELPLQVREYFERIMEADKVQDKSGWDRSARKTNTMNMEKYNVRNCINTVLACALK